MPAKARHIAKVALAARERAEDMQKCAEQYYRVQYASKNTAEFLMLRNFIKILNLTAHSNETTRAQGKYDKSERHISIPAAGIPSQ